MMQLNENAAASSQLLVTTCNDTHTPIPITPAKKVQLLAYKVAYQSRITRLSVEVVFRRVDVISGGDFNSMSYIWCTVHIPISKHIRT